MKEQVIAIDLDKKPDIRIRVIDDNDPKPVKDNKKKYPFELFNAVKVRIETSEREICFKIPQGYTYNGADIPKFFYRVIGSRTSNEFLIASLLHDYILEFKVYILNECIKDGENMTVDEYRRLTSLIFREKLKSQGTNTVKANIMSWCVDVFQHYFNKKGWDIIDKIK